MVADFIPIVMVTLTCLVLPGVAMATWFVYIERQQVS